MKPRSLAVTLASAAFLLVPGSVALAGDDPAKGPPSDAVVAVVATDVVESSPAATTGGVGIDACKWARVKRYATNIFGMTLGAYFQKIDWCYNGSSITSKSRNRWGEVYLPGWSFKGHIGSQQSGGVGSWSYRAWTHAHEPCLHRLDVPPLARDTKRCQTP